MIITQKVKILAESISVVAHLVEITGEDRTDLVELGNSEYLALSHSMGICLEMYRQLSPFAKQLMNDTEQALIEDFYLHSYMADDMHCDMPRLSKDMHALHKAIHKVWEFYHLPGKEQSL
jgi:hypothetical protein